MASKIQLTWGKTLFLICSVAFFVVVGSASAMREIASATPTIVADKADYNPGSTVTLTGANWGADEAVHINVNDDVGQAWRLDADMTASAEGNFIYQFQLPDFFIADYAVTATGASGQVARTTFTDAANLQFLGKDGLVHGSGATEENLGSVSAGTAVAATCAGGSGLAVKATGLGGGQSISWAISYVSGYGDNSALSTPSSRTTTSPSSFTQNGNGAQCVTLTISTTGLAAGIYHGQLQVAQTAGATANTEFYFFTFTVAASTVDTTTSTASATATFGEASVPLSATVTPNTVNVGTVTFTVKSGSTTIGTVTSGTVAGGAASASFPLAGVNAGAYTIQAAYSGGTGFNASNNSGQSPAPTLTVSKAGQAISFAALGNKTFGDPAFTVSATGGASGNPVTFSVGATDNCTSGGTNGATITITGAGSCTVTANQAGATNYNAAPPVPRTFSIAKASQSIAISTHAPGSQVFGQGFTVAATGGASGNPVTFTSAGGCTNVGSAFTMSSGTTDCIVKYNQGGNGNYEAAPQLTETVSAQKAGQSISITTHAPTSRVFGQSFTVAATGGGSGNAVTFSSAGGCSNLGAAFTMTSGTTDCIVKYDQAGNDNYEAAPQLIETVNAQKASQSITITAPAPASKVFGQSFAVAATASSGLSVSFDSAGGCSNAADTFTMTSGTTDCIVEYDQAGNDNYEAAPQLTETVNAQKASQSITITTPAPGSKVFGQGFTIAATASSGLSVSFDSAGGCSNIGETFTMTSGTTDCIVKYDQAGNGNYEAAPQLTETVNAQKADQSISITTHAPAIKVYGGSFTVAATGGGSGSPIVFSSTGVCSNAGATFTMTSGTGNCVVHYNQAGNANYNDAPEKTDTVAAQKKDLTVTAEDKTITFGDAPGAFGVSYDGFIAGDGSSSLGGTLAFSFAGKPPTSYGPSDVTPTNAGVYAVRPSGLASDNYSFAYKGGTFTINKADQSISITTHAPAIKVYGGSFTVAATGGGSGSPIVFSSTGVCSNAGATFTMTSGTGNCVVHYNQAGNANYNDAPEKTDTVAAQKKDLTVTAEDKTITFGDAPGAFGVSYDGFIAGDGSSSLGGTLAFSFAGKPPTSYGPSDVTPTNAGVYAVRPSGLASDNYSFAYKGGTFTINKADQSISITTHAPAIKVYGGSFTVAATGGGSGNPVSFSSAGGCSNGGATFTMTSGTTDCTVKYDQAGNENYNPAPQLTESVNAEKAEQAPLSVTSPDDGTYDQSYDIVTTGGSGTGALTFDLESSTACSIESGKLKITSGTGSCGVTAHKAGDENHNPVTSDSHTVTVHKANQAALSVTSPSDGTFDQSYDIVTAGGSGTGALSFDVGGSSTACSIVAGKLKITSGTGTCAVSATKASDDNYNQTTSPSHSVVVHKADQTIAFAALANRKLGDPDFAVTATASSGLAVSFGSQTTGVCTMSGSTVHIVTIGTCTIRASQAGDSNYNAAATVDRSFTISYVFHGFFQPVDNDKWNAAQGGSAIPVKFDLSGNQGLSIFASGYPRVIAVACPTASALIDSIEETVAASNSGLQYDSTVNPPIGQYIYVWKTDKGWASTCKQLDVKFLDGSTYSARFQFKK